MKKILYLLLSATALVCVITACNSSASKPSTEQATSDSIQLVKQGEYLVNAIGCDDCHSPKKMGANGPEVEMNLRFSGYPSDRPIASIDAGTVQSGMMLFNQDLTSAIGPWGASFSANITSDATGIGNWSETQFVKAMREGKSKGIDGNRPLLPPMPWQNFRKLNDNDLKAIYTYLKTTKPVRNIVPQPVPLANLLSKKGIKKV